MADDALEQLRQAISAVDRELLDALNRRLDLVARVREHKQAAGAPIVDAKREAELLDELAEASAGPLSARGVHAVFAAILDVMKQEARREAPPATATPRAAPPVTRVGIVGTGLVGASVGLAARRAGMQVRGWDNDATRLRESQLDTAQSLDELAADAEIVVVAVPVGSLVDATRAALAAAGPDTAVTDVGSTKRTVAQAIDDPRFVPGHPLAGGASGGPGRASADLFDGAVWFVCDAPRTETVERFVTSIGARPVRIDPDAHDRSLAITSHLPHLIANALMQNAADHLPNAGAALREMTRVAGANAAVWSDIFLENRDLIAEALASHRDELAGVENALRDADRAFFEQWIESSAAIRARMLEHAYRTEAKNLNRIRVRVPDKPGVLARITQTLGAADINIEDFELRHVSPEYGGVLVILVAGSDKAEEARDLLRRDGYSAV